MAGDLIIRWLPLIGLCWVVLLMGYGAIARAQQGRAIAPRVPPNADFGETMCSGRVIGGTLFGRANLNNCLVVWVAGGRLRVDIAFPFGLIPMIGSGLVIDCPLGAIRRISALRKYLQPVLRFEFADPDRPPVDLVIRNEVALLTALGRQPDEATRPLRARTGMRFDRLFARVITGLVGAVFIVVGTTGLASDLMVRAKGVETPAVVEGFAGKSAILRYHFAGQDYRIASQFNGTWHVGDATSVIVMPANPDAAAESGLLRIHVLFTGLAALFLAIALLGARLPGWS